MTLGRLVKLTTQEAFLLLRLSLFTPRLIHILRTCHCLEELEQLAEYDTLLESTLQRILNTEFTQRTLQKAALPMRGGGLGIRSPCDLQLPCLLSSMSAVRQRVQALLPAPIFQEFEVLLSQTAELFPQGSEPGFDMTLQKAVDTVLWEERYQDLLEECRTPAERSCMLAAREPLSYSWMNVIPHPGLGTCLDDRTVSTAVGFRLHAPVCLPHSCTDCHQQVDGNGHHALHCAFSKGRGFRHSMLNREVATTLAKVAVPTQREPSGTHLDPYLRPDGISIVPWTHGKFLAWDVTVADTLAPTYLKSTSLRAGAAAARLESQKTTKYKGLLPQFFFCPIGLETLGPIGPAAKVFFSELTQRLLLSRPEERDHVYFYQRLSMILIR